MTSPTEPEHGVWPAVEGYVAGLLAPHDEALEAALQAAASSGIAPLAAPLLTSLPSSPRR
jgi:hypothetical protein